jgi:outer membrane protein
LSIVRAGMLVAVLSAACAAVDPMRLAPPSAAGVWDGGVTVSAGPADAGPAPSSASERVELGVPEAGRTYDLVALVDLAQKSNPETRIAWESARAAAAGLGLAEGAYYPVLVLLASGGYSRSEDRTPDGPLYTRGWAVTPQLNLQWTLLDFGRRSATSDAAMQMVLQANFHFNRRHQQVTYSVQRAFFAFDAARAQVAASLATQKSAQSVEHDAELRLDRGLATRTEVLLAKQERARADYDVQLARRLVADTWSTLAEAVGISPASQLYIPELADVSLPAELAESVEKAMDRALVQRPDVAALVAQVRAKDAELRKADANFWPTLWAGGMLGFTTGKFLASDSAGQTGPFSYTEPIYSATLNFSWRLFDGFERKNKEREAEALRGQARAELTALQIRTLREVWKAYADVSAARLQYEYAQTLLSASQEAYDSASITYRAGLGTILDLLAAERELARGRSTFIESRAEVLSSSAALAFALGDGAGAVAGGGP